MNVKEKCLLHTLVAREKEIVLMLLQEFAVENDDGNTEPGEVSENGSNVVFKKKNPRMELMEEKEKIEENGAELERREVKVSWILK